MVMQTNIHPGRLKDRVYTIECIQGEKNGYRCNVCSTNFIDPFPNLSHQVCPKCEAPMQGITVEELEAMKHARKMTINAQLEDALNDSGE